MVKMNNEYNIILLKKRVKKLWKGNIIIIGDKRLSKSGTKLLNIKSTRHYILIYYIARVKYLYITS